MDDAHASAQQIRFTGHKALLYRQAMTALARRTLFIIALFTLGRVAFAALTGFGVDESYTIGQSRFFALSYFDHPPLHIWLTGLLESLVGPHWAVRLPFILLFAGSSWVMFQLTRELFEEEAGFWAVLLFNTSPFFFASAGTWVVPDGPFLFFALCVALFASRLVTRDAPLPLIDWIGLGLCLGLAALSKYLAAFEALSVGLVVLALRRNELLRPGPYLAALVTLAVLAPVFLWNAGHDFVSFRFQGARGTATSGLHIGPFIGMAAGQLVWLGLWIVWPIARGLGLARTEAPRAFAFLLIMALPPILFFTVQPLWSGNALPHWTMGGFAMLIPLAGLWVSRSVAKAVWAKASVALISVLALLVTAEARTAFLRRLVPSLPPAADPMLDLYDWTPLQAALKDQPFVIALNWIEGGKIDLVAGRDHIVTVAGDDPRGFALRIDNKTLAGRDGLLVARRKTFEAERAHLPQWFAQVGTERALTIGRAGLPEIELVLVPVTGYRPALPYSRTP